MPSSSLAKHLPQLSQRIQKAVVSLTRKHPDDEQTVRFDLNRSIDLAEQLADQLRQFICVCLDKSIKVPRQDFHRFSINIVTLIEYLAECLPVALTQTIQRHGDRKYVADQLDEKSDSLLISAGQVFLFSLKLLQLAGEERHKCAERDSKQKHVVSQLLRTFHYFLGRAKQFQVLQDGKSGRHVLQVQMDESLILPVDIARGLISRKISFPPPYDDLVQKTQMLRALTSQNITVSDDSMSSAAETLNYPSVDQKQLLPPQLPKQHKYLARISTQEEQSWLSKANVWSKWADCMVEVYGDLFTVWLIRKNHFPKAEPMIYKHLDLTKVVNVDTGSVNYFEIEIGPQRSVRIQIQNAKFRTEFEQILDTLAAIN